MADRRDEDIWLAPSRPYQSQETQPQKIEAPQRGLTRAPQGSVAERILQGILQRRAAQSQAAGTPTGPQEPPISPDRSQSFAPLTPADPISEPMFDSVLANTLGIEGPGVDHHEIRGSGKSQLGVTQRAADAYFDKIKMPRKSVTKLSDKERKDFYRDGYAKPLQIEKMPAPVAMVLFDYGVNSGPGTAAMDLQRVLGVKPDGLIGPKTLAAVKAQDPKKLAEKLLSMQESNYARLVKKYPKEYAGELAENGWRNRIESQRQKLQLENFGQKMAVALQVEKDNPNLKFPKDPDLKVTFNPLLSQVAAGIAKAMESLARIPAYAYNVFAFPQNFWAETFGIEGLKASAPEWLINNPVAEYYRRSAELLSKRNERFGFVTDEDENGMKFQRPTSFQDVLDAGDNSETAAFIGWSMLEGSPQVAFLIGFSWMRLTELGLGVMSAMAAGDKTKENYDKDIDTMTSTLNATGYAVIQYASERMLGTPKVFNEVKAALIKKYGIAGAKLIFKDAFTILIKGSFSEGAEGALASMASDLSDWAMGVDPNALKGLWGRALESFLIEGGLGGAMTVPGAAASAAGDIAQVGADQRAERINAMREDGQRNKVGQSEDGSISWHMNPDGSVNVKGPIEKIRILTEAAGINVKGIPNREGVKFSSAVGNKVIAALRGEKPIRHSRAGEVTEHELWESGDKKGTIKGAPEPYNTKRRLPALRKILKDSAVEGVSGRFWYENSGRAIMALVGGDKEAASKFAKVVAAYSPSTSVAPNMTNALKAWFQWLNNEPIKAGRFGAQDRNVSEILYNDAEWEGEKTNNFYINLMRVIDPENFTENQGVTNDMWMMRMFGYPTDAPTAQAYRFVENETNRLAKELGWEPQQIQAAIWTAIKTRAEDKTVKDKTDAQSERAGDMTWVKSDKGQEVRKFKDDAAEARHRERWFNNAVSLKITPEQIAAKKFDFADAMMAHRAHVSWESRPGRSTGVLPEVNDAPMFQQMEFHEAISKALKDEKGVDILARELGMPTLSDFLGVGMWEGQSSPGTQTEVLLPPRHKPTKDDAHQLTDGVKEVVTAYAATLGRLLYQEGVGWHRPFYATTRKDASGTEINVGHTLLENEMRSLYTTLSQLAQAKGLSINDFGFIASRNGVRILNFTGQDNVMIQNLVKEAAIQSLTGEGSIEYFAHDGDLVANNWKESPNGEDYLRKINNERLRASAARASDILTPKIRAVHEDFARRYGWSNPANSGSESRYKVDPSGSNLPIVDAITKDEKRAKALRRIIDKADDIELTLDAQKELQEVEDRIEENKKALSDHFDKMVNFGKDVKFSRPGIDELGNELGYEEEQRRNQEGRDYIAKHLPELVDFLVQPASLTTDFGMKLLGDYLSGRIRVLSGQPLPVYKHEGFHAFFDAFVGDKTKIQLLDNIKKEYAGSVKEYADKYGVSQDRAAEEVMAELMEHVDNNTPQYAGKTISEKLTTFFRNLIQKMRAFFGHSMSQIQELQDAFYEMRRTPSQARMAEERYLYGGQRAEGYDDVAEADKFVAPDRRVRFEIPDKDAELTFKGDVEELAKEAERIRNDKELQLWDRSKAFATVKNKLEDAIKSKRTLGAMLDHAELYKRYPWAKDIPVLIKRLAGGTVGQAHNAYSTLSPEGSHIRITSKYLDNMTSLYSNSQMETYERFRKTLLHEVQHMLQAYENFAQGGTTKEGLMTYLRLLGEVESRDVEARSRMTDEQRRAAEAYMSQVDPVEAATRDNWKRKIRSLDDVIIRTTGAVNFETPRIYAPGQSRAAQIAKYFFKKTPNYLPSKPVTVYALKVTDIGNTGGDFNTFPSIDIAGETFESKSAALAALKNLDIRIDERKKRFISHYGDTGQSQKDIKAYVIQETHRTEEFDASSRDESLVESSRKIDRKIVATEEDAANFDETKILAELQRRMVGEKKKAVKSESSEPMYKIDERDNDILKDIDQKINYGGYTEAQIIKEYAERGIPIEFKDNAVRIGGSKVSEPLTRIEDEALVQILTEAVRDAKDVRKEQHKLYSKARSQKIAKAMSVAGRTTGERGFYSELGALKGELPKAQFEAIRKAFSQENIDRLFNMIKDHAGLTPFEKINARSALAKMFGEFGGTVPTRSEIGLLDKVFGTEFTKALLSKRTMMERIRDEFLGTLNIPRSLMASFDLSAPFRQGLFFVGRGKQYWPAFAQMFRYFGSEKAFNALQDSITSDPLYTLADESGLAMTQLGALIEQREEAFMSTVAEKIPGIGRIVRSSGRAYVGFLNKLRFDVFKDLYTKAKRAGFDPDEDRDLTVAIAKFINNATGRGDLGSFERAAVVLNGIFFSPRLMASRMNMLNPVYYAKQPPFVRKEMLMSLLSFVSIGMTILGLAMLGGADGEDDPRNADFGKIKIRNTRFDIWGGFQQYIKLAAQLISGKIISSTSGKEIVLGEGYKPITRLAVIARFLSSKEAPVASFIQGWLEGVNGIGEKFDPKSEFAGRFVPMTFQSLYQIAKEDPTLLPAGSLGAFGVGVQTYSDKKKSGLKLLQSSGSSSGSKLKLLQ